MDLTYIYDTEIINNTANNNGHVFIGDGIAVQASQNITVSSNKVQGNGYGMFIYNDKNCKIINNTILSNENKGLKIERVINVTVAKNNVSYSYTGISLRGYDIYECYNNTISENIVKDNNCGINLHRVDNNTVIGNIIINNYYGISLGYSNYNIISGNILIGNDECIIEADCEGNVFKNNDCRAGDKKPAIPGYNLFFLIGGISILSVIIMRKQKH